MELSKSRKKKFEVLTGFFISIILIWIILSVGSFASGDGLLESMAYGISTGLGFIAMSIFCTLGIGGLVWYLIWWSVGKLAFKIIVKVFKINVNVKTEENLTNQEKALVEYINRSKTAGLKIKEIKQKLVNEGGWTNEEVKNVADIFEVSKEIRSREL